MKKDYIRKDNENISDIEFIEKYWTDIWNNQGDIEKKIRKIPSKPEFQIMEPYLNKGKSNFRVLDGGCGLGDWAVYLNKSGYDIVGVDISSDVIAKLKKYFPDVVFQVADIRKTNFPDASFDIYFSWGVFEHFEEGLQPCIKEAMRLLKPGGILLISVPSDNLRHSILGIFKKIIKTPNKNGERFYQWRLNRFELSRELSLAGFIVEKSKLIHKRQGILRCLHHELHLPYEWFITKALSVVLTPFIPSSFIAHMLITVARKP